MITAIKRQWVEALRSGRYTQGQSKLKLLGGTPTFCCLGVLCDILAPEKWTEDEVTDDDGNWTGEYTAFHEGQEENPSQRIQELAGIDGESVVILTRMNDSEGKDFNMIADWIESHL